MATARTDGPDTTSAADEVSAAEADRLPRASAAETAAVALGVALPLLARGIILRRPRVLSLLQRVDIDRHASDVLRRLRDRHPGGPVLLWVPARSIALVLTPEDARRVLLETPEPYTPATPEKTAALRHFQPDGVLISTGAERAERRSFNEDVLEPGRPVHSSGATISTQVREEAQGLATLALVEGRLTWPAYQAAFERAVRRAVLGDGARDDGTLHEQLTALRRRANWAYLVPQRSRLRGRFLDRLRQHLRREEPGSLAASIAAAPRTADTHPGGPGRALAVRL